MAIKARAIGNYIANVHCQLHEIEKKIEEGEGGWGMGERVRSAPWICQ